MEYGLYSIKIVMKRVGSSGLRAFLEERGFDIYRQTPIHHLERVQGLTLDENDELDDGSTFLAIWSNDHRHSDLASILRRIDGHLSVIDWKFTYHQMPHYTDEVPG